MSVRNGVHFVLDPRAMPDDLIAPRDLTAPPFGLGVGQPDVRQKIRRPQ